jgi:hypothetical protein
MQVDIKAIANVFINRVLNDFDLFLPIYRDIFDVLITI